jgi:predicted alpha-1,6-mannanase (GH76 family)
MKKSLIILIGWLTITIACSESPTLNPDPEPPAATLAEQNLLRAMQLVDSAVLAHFTGEGMAMARYYNPYTNVRSDEKGSIWMYTSAIEAVNAVLHGLSAHRESGAKELYDKNYARYVQLLKNLYENAAYYSGTFTLTSYTQTGQWTVYGVNRGGSKGAANVEARENVYDDQEWLIREFFEAYRLTSDPVFLQQAEYLAEYVLDGWDCTRDNSGNEYGGITWGPAYATKHACSNGPIISPLVWLAEYYKGKPDEITYRYIDPADKRTRKTATAKKSDYYLDFAEKIYAWQKGCLLTSDGVYNDLIGGDNNLANQVETIDGQPYRVHAPAQGSVGPPITYNSGSMLSAAADLYRATNDNRYLDDAKKLSDASFRYFAKLGTTVSGYYTYDISGFRNWFNGVLMRAYVDIYPAYKNVDVYIESFQKNLDYAYDNFRYKGFLPTNLLVGWSRDNANNRIEGMFSFAYAAEYATLAKYELEKANK